MDFWTWLMGDGSEWWRGAWSSVVLPTAVTAYALWKHRAGRNLPFCLLVLVGAVASVLSGEWSFDDESTSLHMLPAFFIVLTFLAYWNQRVPPLVAYAGCYLSLVAADVAGAMLMLGPKSPDLGYLHGVGGAGLQDGLFMFPLLGYVLQLYVQWRGRSGGSQKEAASAARSSLITTP